MQDGEIIELFFARNESAIEETDRAYGRYCQYIGLRILGDEESARENCNDTYMKLWDTIPPARPHSLKAYAGMVARQLAINADRRRDAQKRGGQLRLVLDELEECIPDGDGDVAERLALGEALSAFLSTLRTRERRIFVRRYWYAATPGEIAREFLMTQGAVNVMLCRLRGRLREYLEKEGFSI